MQQPPDLPPAADERTIRIRFVRAPHWVRFLAAAADSIVAGLLAFAIITVILIPYFYPDSLPLIYEYAEKSAGDFFHDKDHAEAMIKNPRVQPMVIASQVILYSTFFFYYLLNEWVTRGSSLGKMIFRIKIINRKPGVPLTVGIMLIRAWLKTVLLLFSPLLWVTFLWAFFQKEGRTVHDLITRTWVVD